MPDVGEGLGEGEIVSWRVAVGDRVARDQIILEVETDKSVVELPAPADGVITELGGRPGDVLAVGAVLAVIDTGAGGDASTAHRALASPATRKLALQLGVDLAQVQGSGPGGRVTRQDVEAAAQPGRKSQVEPGPVEAPAPVMPPAPEGSADVEVVPLRGLRRRIAQTMTQSWREIPHITDFREVDATRLVQVRARLRERLGAHLTYLPLFVAAAAAALRRHPALNASLDARAETVTYHRRCHIGIATATGDGLIVPVLHNADRKSLAEIADEAAALAEAARARRVTRAQTSHGTFTITNFGSYGSWLGTPMIRPFEAGIAGFGRIHDAVVAVDGVPAVRPLLPLVIAADHRLIDGDTLGRFAADLAELLADPVLLLADGGSGATATDGRGQTGETETELGDGRR
jgi:pyruvate/2-oxoglutarate dehydrogenase complex dihydrolipoamide acyltransferase (E2) component